MARVGGLGCQVRVRVGVKVRVRVRIGIRVKVRVKVKKMFTLGVSEHNGLKAIGHFWYLVQTKKSSVLLINYTVYRRCLF